MCAESGEFIVSSRFILKPHAFRVAEFIKSVLAGRLCREPIDQCKCIEERSCNERGCLDSGSLLADVSSVL